MNILLKNCNIIPMVSDEPRIIYNRDILICNGKIKKIDKKIKVDKQIKVVNCSNKFVLPGFINCHTHITMQLFKETIDGLSLIDWLKKFIWPIEDKLVLDDVYWCTMLGMLDSINNGITTINDMYFLTDAIVKATNETKINTLFGQSLLEEGGKGDVRIDNLLRLISNIGPNNLTLSFHSLYTCSPKYIEKSLNIFKKYRLPIHMHFCENLQEVKDIKKIHKVNSPIEVLERYFKKEKVILAHCVKLTKNEITRLAKLNASVVHCPVSNLRLGCGIAPIRELEKAGVNVCLGTDGNGSGSNNDFFQTIRLTCLLQKGFLQDPKAINAYLGLKMATINGAKALGIDKNKGSIAIGKDADLQIISLDSTNTQVVNDVISDIVYNCDKNNITDVIIKGDFVKQNGQLTNKKLSSVINHCQQIRHKFFNDK